MEDFEIEYILIDDEAFTYVFLPIILEIGTEFKNEFSIYKVLSYVFNGKTLENILCEQLK
jgi:hypothetical protein